MTDAANSKFVRPDLQAHIYSDALLNNVRQLRSLCRPGVQFCAVVKANAYGHGINEAIGILKKAGVDFFAVAGIFEALHIAAGSKQRPWDSLRRTTSNEQRILILEPIRQGQDAEQLILCVENGFHCSIASVEAAKYASAILADSPHNRRTLKLHVNIETGMGRCGLDTEQAQTLIRKIDELENIALAGVYTHFATVDEDDLSYAYEQLTVFNRFLAHSGIADRKGIIIHAANSAATIKMPQAHFDMVRCGIAVYGYFSRHQKTHPIKLAPAMKLQAPVVQLKRLAKGRSVSYGRSFVTKRDTVAAVIPLGYADGYWRCFSNRAKMKLGSVFVDVIGRVCMDQLLIDVTDVPAVSVGQMVTVIDNDHDSPCGVYTLADSADTICYEILACVPAHVHRIVH